jgi:hypothetical protein
MAFRSLLSDFENAVVQGVGSAIVRKTQEDRTRYDDEWEDGVKAQLQAWRDERYKWTFSNTESLVRALNLNPNLAVNPGFLPGLEDGALSRHYLGINIAQKLTSSRRITASAPLVPKGAFNTILPLLIERVSAAHRALYTDDSVSFDAFFGGIADRVLRELRVDFVLWKPAGSNQPAASAVFNRFLNVSAPYAPDPQTPASHIPTSPETFSPVGAVAISLAVGGPWSVGNRSLPQLLRFAHHTTLPEDYSFTKQSSALFAELNPWARREYRQTNIPHHLSFLLALVMCRLTPNIQFAPGMRSLPDGGNLFQKIRMVPWAAVSGDTRTAGAYAFSRWLMCSMSLLDKDSPLRVQHRNSGKNALPPPFTDVFGKLHPLHNPSAHAFDLRRNPPSGKQGLGTGSFCKVGLLRLTSRKIWGGSQGQDWSFLSPSELEKYYRDLMSALQSDGVYAYGDAVEILVGRDGAEILASRDGLLIRPHDP